MGPLCLPPGFRFHPTDDELVGYYLKKKVDGQKIELEVIPVIDLYKFDPWELPDKSFLPKRDMEWFFFCPRDKKYPNGSRTNRATTSGYWKATGKDHRIICESSVQGIRKTLVFYRGRAPGGERTDWVMNEYRLCEDISQATLNFLGSFALCRVVKRNEQGLKVGDSPGESKMKRSFPSIASDFRPRKNFNKALPSAEEHSSQAKSLFEISNDASPITSELIMAGNDHSGFWVSQYLCDAPNDYSMEQIFLSGQVHPAQFPNPTESCPSSSISPVSSYASFTEENYLVDDQLSAHGSFSSFPSPLHHMNVYCNVEDMGFTNTPFNGVEAYNTVLSPLICRQANDVEEAGLWMQEDSLLVVM